MSDSESEDKTPLPPPAPPSDNESDDDRPPPSSQATPFSALSMLVNNPLAAEPPAASKPETLPTVAPTTASATNGTHSPVPSKPTGSGRNSPVANKLGSPTARGSPEHDDVNDEIQKAMAGVISDLKPQSATPANNTSNSRLSNTSTHSVTDKGNASLAAPSDPASKEPRSSTSVPENPLRPGSASRSSGVPSAPSPVPNRRDESSSDDGIYGIKATPTKTAETIDDLNDTKQTKPAASSPFDDAFFDTKVATVADEHRPASATTPNTLDETTRFVPASSGSRAPSVSSKRSIRATPDETSTSGDEKRTQMSPSKGADDAGTDTDRENQEVATVARRPSRAMSPFDRPRSPTPDDSTRALVKTGASPVPTSQENTESNPPAEHQPQETKPKDGSRRGSAAENRSKSPSPALSDQHRQGDEKQQIVPQPPQSRRESANKGDQQQTSRPSSAAKPKHDDSTLNRPASRPGSGIADEFPANEKRSKLIKTEETFQLPANNMHEQRPAGSAPSSPRGESTGQANSVTEQNRSRPPSADNRRSQAASPISNEKVIDGDIMPSHSRRESNISQQNALNSDRKSPSPRASQVDEKPVQASGSRRNSDVQAPDQSGSRQEPAVASRRTSDIVPESTSQPRQSNVNLELPGAIENDATGSKTHSRQASNASAQQVASQRPSLAHEPQISDARLSMSDEQKASSRRESAIDKPNVPTSQRGSTALDPLASDSDKVESGEPKVPSRRQSAIDKPSVPASQRGSTALDPLALNYDKVESGEPKVPSRRQSAIDKPSVPASQRGSTALDPLALDYDKVESGEPKIPSRRGSATDEVQPSSKRESTVVDQAVASRKASVANEPKSHSRSGSFHDEQQPANKGASPVPQQPVSSRPESVAEEPKTPSRRSSFTEAPKVASKRPSAVSDHQESNQDEAKKSSRQSSARDEAKPSSKRESTALVPPTDDRRASGLDEPRVSSRRNTVADETRTPSKRGSTTNEQHGSSHGDDLAHAKPSSSRKGSTTAEHHDANKQESLVLGQQPDGSNRRQSHLPEKPTDDHRKSSSDEVEHKSPSKPASRKESFAEQPSVASRRESQLKPAAPPQDTEHRDQPSLSPRRSYVANAPKSAQSTRRNSDTKSSDEASKVSARRQSGSARDEPQQHAPSQVKDESRRSSFNMMSKNNREINLTSDSDVPTPTSTKHKQDHAAFEGKRQKSSSSAQNDDKRRVSLKDHSGQASKRNSNTLADETTLIPFPKRSGKGPSHNAPYLSGTESEYENGNRSKLPQVNAISQPQAKPRRPEGAAKPVIPLSSNRSDYKALSSSHASTPNDDDRNDHWIRQVPVPSIHLTDDEASTPREAQQRPQSPRVEQIAERNPVVASPINTSTAKTRSPMANGQKRKDQHRPSRRSNSADSVNHIRLVDDHSLDSASENNVDFDRRKRRNMKSKGKDIATNTERMYEADPAYGDQNTTYQLQPRSFFDDQEYSPQKPMRATKPMSDHLHGPRRRVGNKDQILTTPETTRDTDTPVVRRSVKQTKDSNQEKDPVNVNVTVVVKKFAGTSNERPARVTAEAYVEDRSPPPSKHQKQQPYQEPVQQPVASLEQQHHSPKPRTPPQPQEPYFEPVPRAPSVHEQPPAEEAHAKGEEPSERPKSTEQPTAASPKPATQHEDRYTQSDTEQIITEQQKKRRRPKRISRTCQTYECVFRRMDREQAQDLRATSDTEKNIQTRKSQLRPRKKSPKKNHSIYLSADSFRMEDFLPNQPHQSRRNMTKSSAIARSLSPQGGKLLILRPTLPFHHSDAVNVQRVCLQYAIDLIPNEHTSNGSLPGQRNKLTVINQPDASNALPMIRPASPVTNTASNRSQAKEKPASQKHDEQPNQRKKTGTH